ncbi:MAG: hypothetical protein SFV21_22055 [Rhodospirillaceae bacterium]|nr:hypothetical protein [Rhodospirillaceae bacterium]
MNLMEDIEARLRALQARLKAEGTTPERAKLLMLAAGALVWLSAVVMLAGRIDAAEARLQSQQSEIARLTRLVDDTSWGPRLAESEGLRTRLDARFWRAATSGLGEASFEAWLRDRFQAHGLEVQQVLITRTQLDGGNAGDGLDGVERMTAKVISAFRPAGAVNFTADAAENERMVIVDRLIVRTGRNARMETDVSTFLKLQ